MKKGLGGEDGFTLPEVIVSMVLTALVLLALYAVFDASVRVFGAGGAEAEAAQDARQGLARMEREIRAAYPRDRANGDGTLLTDFGRDHLTFGNDLDGDRRISDPRERISYAPSAAGVPTRNGVRLVRSARDVDGDGEAMTFEYLDAGGGAVAGEAEVALVRVRLEVSVNRRDGREVERVLETTVALRNR